LRPHPHLTPRTPLQRRGGVSPLPFGEWQGVGFAGEGAGVRSQVRNSYLYFLYAFRAGKSSDKNLKVQIKKLNLMMLF